MKNRIFISMQDGLSAPKWLEHVEDYMIKAMDFLNYSNEEVSLLFCTDDFIQELNKSYRDIDSPTDVLSFENDESYQEEGVNWHCMGDIAISLDTLPKNAAYFHQNENQELKRLLLHGLLHLNGMDHGEEHIEEGVKPTGEMLVLQEDILEKLKDETIIK